MKTAAAIAGFVAVAGVALAVTAFIPAAESASSPIAKDGLRWSDAFGDLTTDGAAAPGAGVKGDRLPIAAECGGQAWPYLAPTCLVLAEGAASLATRTVTLEYRSVEPNTSILVRMPAMQMASR